MRINTVLIFLLLGLLCLSPALADKSGDAEKAKLVRYMAKLFNADQKSITIESLENSSLIKGAKEGVVTIGRQNGRFFVVGQKLIIGNLYDLSTDPYQENMKKISLSNRPHHGSGPVTLIEYSDFQ